MTCQPSPAPETPKEWAARVVAERGPIPDHLLQDIAARARHAAAARAQDTQRPA